MTPPHTRRSLVQAWLDRTEFATAGPDLRDYHAARYRALAAAIEADLDEKPELEATEPTPSPPNWLISWLAERPLASRGHRP